MQTKPNFPLRLFYDGACSVCATEVERYGRMDREGRLILVDISAPDFDPAPLGFTRDELMYQMHAIDRNGTAYRNVEAFWAIWQAFPASTLLGLLGAFITLPVVKPVARLCYKGFARIRKYLPKRDVACTMGSCRINTKKPR
jgi:predicted DCC family thiol-disulfide oxidoreductase YuxK